MKLRELYEQAQLNLKPGLQLVSDDDLRQLFAKYKIVHHPRRDMHPMTHADVLIDTPPSITSQQIADVLLKLLPTDGPRSRTHDRHDWTSTLVKNGFNYFKNVEQIKSEQLKYSQFHSIDQKPGYTPVYITSFADYVAHTLHQVGQEEGYEEDDFDDQ